MAFWKNIFGLRFRNIKNRDRKLGRARLDMETLEDRLVPAGIAPTYVIFDPPGSAAHPNSINTTPVGLTPLQIRTAYGVNSSTLTGAGETIAIIDMYNDSTVLSDLDVFDKEFAATSSGTSLYTQYGAASTFLTVYSQSGAVINPATTTAVPVDSTGGWEGEESLDVQWAHAMAPGAKIDLIECSTNLFTGVQTAASLPGVSVVSMSWGESEFSGETADDSYFTTPSGHIGVTFLASTGDDSVGEYPAFSPNVVAVGGTTLTLNSSNGIAKETAWSTGSDTWNTVLGTGGGTSAYEATPSYQVGVQTAGHRTIPDVAFDADPNSGVAVYDSFSTSSSAAAGWEQIGGTSLACPSWAGIIAMGNQGRAAAGEATLGSSGTSTAQQALYGLPAGDFHDITSGSITASGHTYTAGTGYDEVSGRGTPVVNLLAAGLAGTTTVTAPAAPTLTATVASGSQINLSWTSVSGATSYLVDESINGVFTQIASLSSTSYDVTGLASGTAYTFEVAAANSAGTTWSASKSATTTKTAPTAPVVTATVASGTQINLTWNSVAGATSYLVDELSGTTWKQLTGLTGTSYEVTGLTAGDSYSFRVGAVNTTGTTWSATVSATTVSKAPAAPTFTLTVASTPQINIAWTDVATATSYLIDELVGTTWTQIASLASTATSYQVTGLNAGTTYSFKLAAVNSIGTTWAASQSAATLSGPPAAPTFTTTAASASEIDLAWKTVSGATSYVIDEWINGAWTQIATVGSGTTFYAVTGLSGGTTYYVDLAAVNSSGTTWAANYQSATTSQAVVIHEPTADVAYSPVSGSLFGPGGPSCLDVSQGEVGDCWLLASLAEVADRAPQDIENMFTYDGTTVVSGATVGLYTVRYFNGNGVATYVTVDTELPAGGTYYDRVTNGLGTTCLWVALAEKAYAEANGDGYVTSSNEGVDSFDALNDGYPSWALQAITGKSSSGVAINPTNIGAAWNAGDLIVLTTGTPASSYIVGSHCYAVVGYNASSSQPFEIFNPWGTTSSGWAPGETNEIYGLFNANAAFVSQNFDDQFYGVGAVAGQNYGTGQQMDWGMTTQMAQQTLDDGLAAFLRG